MINSINKGKHLKHYQRVHIQISLEVNISLKEIAKELGKDPTTISKEVKRNRTLKNNSDQKLLSKCMHHKYCTKTKVCDDSCDSLCKKCRLINCYRRCPDYTQITCKKTQKFPHVCNGCLDKSQCKLPKYYYRASVAHSNYETILKESREGISLTEQELNQLDELVSPLIKKGQSISHIYAANSEDIPVSIKSLYNYVDNNLLVARNIDLRRRVKFKPRKSKKLKDSQKNNQKCRQNRTYNDFTQYMASHPNINVVEMDTVKGKQEVNEPSILTLFFRQSSLMVAFLLEKCTQSAVSDIFDMLHETLGDETFKKTFPVILTDNGSEFKNPDSIEFDSNHNRRTTLFYCDPHASWQKGKIEKNHEYIRYIVPKGKSFKSLNQTKITLMMNHINSAIRPNLSNNSPISIAKKVHDKKLLDELHLKEIHPNKVHLTPSLIKD